MRIRRWLGAWLLAMLATLAGCAGDPLQHAESLAQPVGLQHELVQAGQFRLTAYVRITRPAQPLTIYIEGDGLAWRSRYEPSNDPTPRRALGLALAAADPGPNVVYLARPCQFTPMADNPRCTVDYWTDKRFAPEVVASMNEAVSHYLARMARLAPQPDQHVNLVGYSGGGAIAVLVAARRHDVASLRTVAGNLDHVALNLYHKVSAMPGSLNAIDFADRVAGIPQRHFSGSDDKIVLTRFAQAFVTRAGPCAHLEVVAGLSHEGDWAAMWPRLLAQPLTCSASSKG